MAKLILCHQPKGGIMQKILFLITTLLSSFSMPSEKNIASNHSTQGKELISHAYASDPEISSEIETLSGNNDDLLYQKDYYSSYYFKNLSDNFAYNAFGTCTYVAIAELLSFYDTYWSDSFISSEFEKNSEFEGDFTQYSVESPGIKREDEAYVDSLTLDQYYSYIDEKSDTYFQLKLLKIAKEYFGEIKFDGSFNSLGMTHDEMMSFIKYYLYECRPLSENEVGVSFASGNVETVKMYILSKVQQGIPVIIRTDDLNGHAFIAYDYDESTENLYAHAGLSDPESNAPLTHVNLRKIDDMNIWDATSIDVKMKHTHARNYVAVSDGTSCCSCFYLKPNEISIKSGNYRDVAPTYVWKSLYKERWYSHLGLYYRATFLDSNDETITQIEGKKNPSLSLSQEQWDQILSASGNEYKIKIELMHSSGSFGSSYTTISEAFKKPGLYNEISNIKPSEYGFDDAYPTDEETKTVFTNHVTSSGFKFQTRRYRTGYIHNEYIVMSPTRKGINEAYIEYRFDTAVTRIDVELAHWRELSSEMLQSSTGTALFQQFINDEWVTRLDLLSSEADLTRYRSEIKTYTFEFEQPAYMVRFYSSSYTNNTNDNNRGRICIGNMAFYESEYSLPVSGFEAEYNPTSWNKTFVWSKLRFLKKKTNCYSYALNAQKNPNLNDYEFMQPGQSIKNHSLSSSELSSAEILKNLISMDAQNLDFGFRSVEETSRCSEGCYKVALVMCLKTDYHWYRQNRDGSWSHKPGKTNVINYDTFGKLIMDPRRCGRNYSYCNYDMFLGYYEIKPLNTYYK